MTYSLNDDIKFLIQDGFDGLNSQINICKQCSLYRTVTRKVIIRGSISPKVVFVGEAPGKNEDKQGIPFCGSAGRVLDELIEYMDLNEKDYAIINTVKCRPPNNRRPNETELFKCKNFLHAQLYLLNPSLIILLGNTATQAFCIPSLNWGETKKVLDDIYVLKMYHPAALLYKRSLLQTQKDIIDKNRILWQ